VRTFRKQAGLPVQKATEFGEITQRLELLRRSKSFKVTDFDIIECS